MTELELENLYNKNQIKPVLKEYIKSFPIIWDSKLINASDAVLAQKIFLNAIIYKKVTINALLGLLHVEDQLDSDQLVRCINYLERNKLILIITTKDSFSIQLKHQIPLDLQLRLDKYCFPLPMIEPPTKVDHNHNGYYDDNINFDGIVLNNFKYNYPVNFDALDLLNSTKLRLNKEIINKFEAKWKANNEISKSTLSRFNYATKALAQELPEEIYLTSKYDYRGRMYYQGFHFNPQGCDYNRSCIEFSKGEIVED